MKGMRREGEGLAKLRARRIRARCSGLIRCFDVLAHVAYALPTVSREEGATTGGAR